MCAPRELGKILLSRREVEPPGSSAEWDHLILPLLTCPALCHWTSPFLCTSTATNQPVKRTELDENCLLRSPHTSSHFLFNFSLCYQAIPFGVASHCISILLNYYKYNLLIAEPHYWKEGSSISVWIMNMPKADILSYQREAKWMNTYLCSFIYYFTIYQSTGLLQNI